MKPLIAFNLWQWVEEHRQAFEPPVGNKVMWEDSQFTAMIIRGPNARRDFHVDPSDELFYMLKGEWSWSTCRRVRVRNRSFARASSSWCRP
jgi:3-hydroxyanthranilate 3,4-dioxygenase